MSTSTRPRPFALVIEADAVAGLDLADALDGADYDVAGPLCDATTALAWLGLWTPDCAVLDLPALGHEGIALAEALRDRGVPFLIYSGHLRADYAAAFADTPWITKPALAGEIVAALGALGASR